MAFCFLEKNVLVQVSVGRVADLSHLLTCAAEFVPVQDEIHQTMPPNKSPSSIQHYRAELPKCYRSALRSILIQPDLPTSTEALLDQFCRVFQECHEAIWDSMDMKLLTPDTLMLSHDGSEQPGLHQKPYPLDSFENYPLFKTPPNVESGYYSSLMMSQIVTDMEDINMVPGTINLHGETLSMQSCEVAAEIVPPG
jgi:hypothetical protein